MEFSSSKEATLFYASQGFRVLPLDPNSVEGKTPYLKGGVHRGTTSTDEILGWHDKFPEANWGVSCGKESGIAVLDIDPRNGGDVALEYLLKKYQGEGRLPQTPVVLTGGGGYHYWFRYPRNQEIKNRTIAPGVEIKVDGYYVLVPPSITQNVYKWAPKRGLEDIPLAEMPGWMVELAARGAQNFDFDDEGKVGPGQRNSYLTSLAGSMRRRGMHREAILAALKVENDIRCNPPISDEGELEHITDSISRYSAEDPALKEHDDDLDLDARMEALKSEEIILGYVIGGYDSTKTQIGYIMETLRPEHFMDASHRMIFKSLRKLFLASVGVDAENLKTEMQSTRDWGRDKINDEYIDNLVKRGARIVYPGDVRFNTMRVLSAYMLREAAIIFSNGAEASKKGKDDPEELISFVSARLMKLLDGGSEQQIYNMGESLDKVWKIIEAAERGEMMMNEPTGWEGLDETLIGLPKGELTIVAARPSQGKTAFVIQLAVQMLKLWHEKNEPGQVLFFSAEMTHEQLTMRNISRESEIDSTRIRSGKMTPEEKEKAKRADQMLRQKAANFWIDQTASPTGQYMMAKALSLHRPDNPVRLVIFDFLELIGDESGDRDPNKVTRIEEALKKLKQIAKQLNCAVVVLSQLKREVETRATLDNPPIPRPSDLRWSGMGEQLANQIIMLYYAWQFFKGGIPYKEEPDREAYEIHVPKNRDGKIGVVDLRFIREHGKFVDVGTREIQHPAMVTTSDIPFMTDDDE